MFSKDLKILRLQSRIVLLASRGVYNERLIAKARRQLRLLQK